MKGYKDDGNGKRQIDWAIFLVQKVTGAWKIIWHIILHLY